MRGEDIADRLKAVLPKYTNDFSDIISVASLTNTAGTATVTTTSDHNLVTGDYITMKGVVDPVSIATMTRVENVVTVITASPHKIVFYDHDPKLTVEISDATPAEYNGSHILLAVENETTLLFKIDTAPATPATVPGVLLQSDFDGYNGYKQITVTSPASFTYTAPSALNSPAGGVIEMSKATRIESAATIERVAEFYTAGENKILDPWLFVVVMGKTGSKEGTTSTDVDAITKNNQIYFQDTVQNFSIFVHVPCSDSILAGKQADTARGYETPILKALGNFNFPSSLTEGCYQPANMNNSEEYDYNRAFYVHRFDFGSRGYIQPADVVDENPGVPLEVVDGTVIDKDMIYKPEYR